MEITALAFFYMLNCCVPEISSYPLGSLPSSDNSGYISERTSRKTCKGKQRDTILHQQPRNRMKDSCMWLLTIPCNTLAVKRKHCISPTVPVWVCVHDHSSDINPSCLVKSQCYPTLNQVMRFWSTVQRKRAAVFWKWNRDGDVCVRLRGLWYPTMPHLNPHMGMERETK